MTVVCLNANICVRQNLCRPPSLLGLSGFVNILAGFWSVVLLLVLLAIIALVVLFLPLLIILLFVVFRFAFVLILVGGIVEGADSTEPQLLALEPRARAAGQTLT